MQTGWETEAGQQDCGKGPGGLGQWQLEYESALPWQPGEILELDYASLYFLFNFTLRQVIPAMKPMITKVNAIPLRSDKIRINLLVLNSGDS